VDLAQRGFNTLLHTRALGDSTVGELALLDIPGAPWSLPSDILQRGRLQIGSSSAGSLHLNRSIVACFLGRPAALPRNDVAGVPSGPVVLRSARFVFSVALLGLSQKLCKSCDVAAEAPSGKPRLDFLKQPPVAVWIAE
jgi:hypothetical protein